MRATQLEIRLPSNLADTVLTHLTASESALTRLRRGALRRESVEALQTLAEANLSLARALTAVVSRQERSKVRRSISEDLAASFICARASAHEYFAEFIRFLENRSPGRLTGAQFTARELNEHLSPMNADQHRVFLTEFGVLHRTGARRHPIYRLTVRGVRIARLLNLLSEK